MKRHYHFLPAFCAICGAKLTYENIMYRMTKGRFAGYYSYCRTCKNITSRQRRQQAKMRAFKRKLG